MGKLKKINAGVGKRIRRVRMRIGLSQEAFGAKIGVSQTYIGLLQRGLRTPSQALVEFISKVFGVSADWLRTGRNR